VDRAIKCNVKGNKSARERQISYDLIHMWNLRNLANEQKKKQREKKLRNTLNYREQTEGYQRGGE